jgi:hypothetical protein
MPRVALEYGQTPCAASTILTQRRGQHGHANVEACSQKEGIVGHHQVDLGIDRRMGPAVALFFGKCNLACAIEQAGPAAAKSFSAIGCGLSA